MKGLRVADQHRQRKIVNHEEDAGGDDEAGLPPEQALEIGMRGDEIPIDAREIIGGGLFVRGLGLGAASGCDIGGGAHHGRVVAGFGGNHGEESYQPW